MPLKLGDITKNIPYAAAYLGEKLVYQKTKEQAFSECPFPTSWDVVTTGTEYTAENDYGTWRITASGYSDSCYVSAVFDGDLTIGSSSEYFWKSSMMASSGSVTCGIECPENILIKPSKITAVYRYLGNSSKKAVCQGYNPDTSAWETLYTFTSSSSSQTDVVDISTENFYSKFRILTYRYSISYPFAFVYEFQINSGMIKNI